MFNIWPRKQEPSPKGPDPTCRSQGVSALLGYLNQNAQDPYEAVSILFEVLRSVMRLYVQCYGIGQALNIWTEFHNKVKDDFIDSHLGDP